MTTEQLIIEPLAGYEPEIGQALWMLEDTRRRTLKTLDGLDPAALDWMPSGGHNTIGALLYHIAVIEADWLYVEVLETAFPSEIEALFPYAVRDDAQLLSAVRGVPLDEHLARLAAVRRALLTAFQNMRLEEFQRVRHFPDQYDVTPAWVLHHLMQHEAEHRGQIGELRSLCAS